MDETTTTPEPYQPGPGMGADGRCMTCDGRYCGTSCEGRPGYVWVVGLGWKSPEAAKALEALGREVYWQDAYTSERYGY